MDLVAVFRLTKKESVIFNVLAGLIFVVGFFIFLFAAVAEKSGKLAQSIIANHNAAIMFTFVGTVIVLHELLHILGYKFFGGKVKCGFKLFNIYTMDISGSCYSTFQMLVIMLLPAIVLSAVFCVTLAFLPQYIYYIFIGLMFNISGSAGDIIMACIIIRYGWNCKIKDTDNGFSIYSVTAGSP